MKNDMRMWLLMALAVVGLSFRAVAQEAAADNQTLIQGVVIDQATGEAVYGATIRMEKFSVFTNEEGRFRLKIDKPTTIMKVSAPGYGTRYIEWRGRGEIRIELSAQRFSNPLGAPSRVEIRQSELVREGTAYNTLEDLRINPSRGTVEELIANQLGSVRTVTRSGQPGIGAMMFLRGINTLNSNTQPLILVDGITMQTYEDLESLHSGFYANFLSNLNMDDIENITVIKDAVSLYGARAANGVILIETKRGHDMATKITANVNMGVTLRPNTIPTLDAEQSRTLMGELYKGSLLDASAVNSLGMFNENPNYLYYNKYHNNTDWKQLIYQDGFNQGYSVTATGGDAVGMYALSVGYVNNKGNIKGNSEQRLAFRFNSDIQIAKNLTSAVNFAISSLNYDLKNDGMLSRTSPSYLSLVKSPMFYPYTYSLMNRTPTSTMETYDDLGINNVLPVLELSQQASDMTNFQATARPVWKINKNFTLMALAGYTLNKLYESYFTPRTGVAPMVVTNISGTTAYYYSEARSQNTRDVDTHLELSAAYGNKWGGHRLDVTGGYRFLSNRRIWDVAGGYNTTDDTDVFVSSKLNGITLDGSNSILRDIAWFANASWNYQQKYVVNAGATMESSSRFGSQIEKGALKLMGVNWAFFPSVSASWLMSAEDFMASATAIDRLRLRASWGLSGNDDIPDYVSYAYFASTPYYESVTGLVLANLGNPSLKWETTRKANFGIDASFFGDRLSLVGDIFANRTRDLLVQKQLDPIGGFETYWANDGELSNRGFELSVNARLINYRNFRWEMTLAASHYQNRIERLADGDYTTRICDADILTAKGRSLGTFYGYQYKGVYASEAEAATAYKGGYMQKRLDNGTLVKYHAGDAIFEDVDDNGIIDDKDKMCIGDPNPTLTGIASTTLAYKGVSLTAVFGYSIGSDIYNYQRRVLESMSSFENQSLAVLNRWRADGQITDVPRASYGDPMGNADFSTRWIEDGSYIRLRNLTLAWDLPYKIPFLQGLAVWASASNLLTFSKYLGCDPENSYSNRILTQGIDTGLVPQTPSFAFGLRINL